MAVCFASSSVISFGAQLKNKPDRIVVSRIKMQKIEAEVRLSILGKDEWEGQQLFLTSIILHLVWAE
jgi:hypothetical protein